MGQDVEMEPGRLESQVRTERVLVQVGVTGLWAEFTNPLGLQLQVDDQVVCQTGRGQELGGVKWLSPSPVTGFSARSFEENRSGDLQPVGTILRLASDSDLLAQQRLRQRVPLGLAACEKWLADQGFSQLLLDVDIPLDGHRIYFHYLGEVDESLEAATEQLVEIFDSVSGIRQFTQAVATGCGPDCNSDGGGCGRSVSSDSPTNSASPTDSASPRRGCVSCSLRGGCHSSAAPPVNSTNR